MRAVHRLGSGVAAVALLCGIASASPRVRQAVSVPQEPAASAAGDPSVDITVKPPTLRVQMRRYLVPSAGFRGVWDGEAFVAQDGERLQFQVRRYLRASAAISVTEAEFRELMPTIRVRRLVQPRTGTTYIRRAPKPEE